VEASHSDKAEEYMGYAEHCLRIADRLPDRESRIVQREMAAEWLKFASHAVEQAFAPSTQATSQLKKYG
jgi:hypothetical protein